LEKIDNTYLMFSSLLFSLFLALYFFILAPTENNALLWARYSANLSFLYLFAAFSASALNQWFKNQATKILLKNRRYLGLSFAIAHTFHLAALIYFFLDSNDQPSMVSIIGGGLGYLLMYAMAITSTDKMVRRLGIKNWRLLHTIGINYLIGAFLFTFIANAFQKDIYSIYTIFTIAVFMIWMLKLINRARQ
jgi:sulfoxide reductase heme-binding subunit YedZ